MGNRTTLRSAQTAVVISESPAFKTVDESGFLFAGVRSLSYGFTNVRADVSQIGSQDFYDENIVRQPDVNLQMSYAFTPTFANEELMGINYNLDSKAEFSIFKGLSGASYNFYIYNHPDQEADAIEYLKDGQFPNGGEVVSIGNAYLTNYSINFAVGDFPTVDVEFDCSNIKMENYFSDFIESPAINLESGNNVGVGSTKLLDVNYFEPRKFGDIYDLDRSNIETILPYDIQFEMDNLSIGGQRMELENHRITEFSVSMPINRSNLYRLGSDYVCGREIQYPINGTLSISSLVTTLEAGFISGLVIGDQISNLRILSSDCRKQITSQFYFEDIKLESIEYQTLVNEQTQYNLEFSFQVTEDKGFKSTVTEQDIGVTRFIDDQNSVYEYILGDVIANWQSGDLNGYKVAFGELRDYDVFDGAFADCTNINQSVFLPPQIQFFGNDVFNGCSNLPSYYFDSECNITSFGDRSFKNCTSLENIFLPKSVNTLGEECFMGCDSAAAIFLDSVVNIGDRAFYNCSGLNESLYLPSTLSNLGESVFENCSGFQGGLFISESLKEIKQKTFKNARGLSFDLTIPDNVSGIGPEAFYRCEGFGGELSLSSQLSTIEDYTFYGCSSLIGDLLIPSNVNEIKIGAFQGCSGFDGIISLPNVTVIGDNSFSGCSNLRSNIFLNSGIVSIGDRAFMNCSSASQSLTIPSGIQSIGDAAFSGCVGITDIYMNSPTSVFQGNNAFAGINGCLYVAPFYYNSYIAASSAGLYQGMPVCYGSLDTVIYDAVTSEVIKFKRGDIPTDWYSNQTRDSYLVIGSTCTKIESGAFTDSEGLQGFFVVPEELTYIGDYAFKGCGFDGELLIPDTVLYLGSGAFENCSGFDGSLIIGDGIDTIKGKTFKNCTNIDGDIILNPEIVSIEDEAFYNCNSASGEIFLGFNLRSIGDYAFYNCSSAVGDLEIPDLVNYVGDYAFYNCLSLDGQLINSTSLSYLGNYAFQDCSLLTGPLVLPETLVYLGSGAYKNCKGLNSEIDLSLAQIDAIYEETFFGCSGLNGALVIPDNVLEIGDRAFKGCVGLTESITITNIAAKNIGTDAFDSPLPFDELIVSDFVREISQGDFDYFKNDAIYLTLQEGLTSISGYAFSNYSFIGDLDVPLTLEYIGDAAFSGNSFGGTYDFVGSNVSYIGDGAFYDLNLIDGNIILENIEYIGDYAFYNNSSLNGYFQFGTTLREIGEYAFAGCSNAVGDLIIPNLVSGLGQYAFLNCSNLSGVISLPNNEDYNYIKTGTFKNCSSLSGDLLVHDSISGIESEAFLGCTSLNGDITITDVCAATLTNNFDDSPFARLVISDSVVNVDNGEFDYFASRTMEVVFQEGLSGILDNAFDNYNFEGELNFPSTMTGIGVSAFQNCNGFSGELIISEEISGVGVNAFRSCGNLSGNLILPSNLVNLGDGAFVDCVKLDGYLQVSDLTAQAISSYTNVFGGTSFTELRASSSDFLIEDTEFDSFNAFVGDLVVTDSAPAVGEYAFVDTYSFANKLTISDSSESIGDYAFSGNSFTGDLYIPSLSVGFASFAECVGFNGRFTIEPVSVQSADDYAFYNCSNLSGNLIVQGMATIGNYSFANMSSLDGEFRLCELPEDFDGRLSEYDTEAQETVSLVDSSLTSFGDYAFYNCSNLSGNLVIPDTVTQWGDYAFLDMSSLDGFLILGSGVSDIPQGIFKNCSSLTCYGGIFTIPESIDTIGQEAFYNCSSLSCSLKIANDVVIGTNAFFGTNFNTLVVPSYVVGVNDFDYDYFINESWGLIIEDGVQQIRDKAFDGYSLTGPLNLPSSLNLIGKSGFKDCDGFDGDLNIPTSITTISESAFENCSGFDGEFVLHSDIYTFGDRCFKNMSSINGLITFNDDGTYYFGEEAFYNCSLISGVSGELVMPDFVSSIGELAFGFCSNVNNVFIENIEPNAFLGNNAFSGCNGVLKAGVGVYRDYLQDPRVVEINGEPYFQGLKLSGVGIPETTFYTGAAGDEKGDPSVAEEYVWDVAEQELDYTVGPDSFVEVSTFNTILPGAINNGNLVPRYAKCWLDIGDRARTIAKRCFYDQRNLYGIIALTDSLEEVQDEAFYNTQNIEGITFGANLLEIGYQAFRTSMYNPGADIGTIDLNFNNRLKFIREQAFNNNRKIRSVNFGTDLEEIGDNGFSSCPYIDGLDFSNSPLLSGIGNSAFAGAYTVSQLVFNNALISIGDYAFQNLGTAVAQDVDPPVFPETLTYIGQYAFDAADIGGTIGFPSSLDSLETGTFRNSNITSISSFGGVTGISGNCFQGSKLATYPAGQDYLYIDPVIEYYGNSCFQDIEAEKVLISPAFDSSKYGQRLFEGCLLLSGVEFQPGDKELDYINSYTFKDCTSLRIPDLNYTNTKISGIGRDAFNNCEGKGLGFNYELIIPSGVKLIDQYAFANIRNTTDGWGLSGLYFESPATSLLEEIGQYAFDDCQLKNELILPDGLKIIGSYAFQDCDLSGTIDIPELESMGEYVFQNAKNLEDYTWPLSLSGIPRQTFAGCTSLSGYNLPNYITGIGTGAFQNCSSLNEDIILPTNLLVNGLGQSAFNNSAITDIDFNQTVDLDMKGYTFENCDNLTSIIIKKVKSMYYDEFDSCDNLTTVTIQNPAAADFTMEGGNFKNCKKLQSITLPQKLKSMLGDNFSQLGEDISYIDFSSTQLTTIGNTNFSDSSNYQFRYSAISGVDFPNTLTSMGSNNFQYLSGLKSITLPSSLTSIGGYNWAETYARNKTNGQLMPSQFEFVDLSATSITNIGTYAFQNSSVKEVFLPNTLQLIDQGAFATSDNAFSKSVVRMSGITIPDSVTGINSYAFEHNSGIKEVTWGTAGNLWKIQTRAFSEARNLMNGVGNQVLELPSGLTDLETQVFEYCSSLSGVTFPDSMNTMVNNNFQGCTSLSGVSLNEIASIGNSNFLSCSSLSGVDMENLQSMGNTNFQGCSNLKSVNFNNLQTMGNSNFSYINAGIPQAGEWFINSGISSIGNQNFEETLLFQTMRIESGFAGTIGNYNWRNCTALRTGYIDFVDGDGGTIGTHNWLDCDDLQEMQIKCPLTAFAVNGNNFGDRATRTIEFKIDSSVISQYTDGTFSGQQGLIPGDSITVL